jgi:hypothetical protein
MYTEAMFHKLLILLDWCMLSEIAADWYPGGLLNEFICIASQKIVCVTTIS